MRPTTNIASHLGHWADATPLKAALRTPDGDVDYADLDRWAGSVAAALRALDVAKGDRVAVLAGSDAAFVAALYGIWKLGAIAVLLHPRLAAGDLERQTRACGAGVIVVDDDPAHEATAAQVALAVEDVRVVRAERGSAAVPAVELDPDDLAIIAYTSGTTGPAKGAAHTHRAMLVQVETVAAHYSATERDEILSLLPLFLFSIFVVGPMLAVTVGAACRIIPRYNAHDVVRAVEGDRTTIAAAVPLFFHDIGEMAADGGTDVDLSSLRIVTSGGAPLPETIRDDVERRYGFRLVQLYGMTEAPAIITSDPLSGDRRTGSVGLPLPHLRVTIEGDDGREQPPGGVGEVCVSAVDSGPYAGVYRTMACYWGMPEATAEALRDGRLHTGDVGHLDADGFLYLVDRKKDIIIRGGMNVYPREIEVLLATDDRVTECAVVGEPHPRYGEVPVAYVRLRPGTESPAGELLDLANRRLPSEQRLEAVHIVADFPRNSLGKVLRRELAASGSAAGEGARA